MAGLRQFVRQRKPIERCEMCGRELAAEHQHLIEPEKRKLVCACDACSVLFTTQAGTKLRRVPRRVRFLADFRMSDSQWNSLMIPIEMAFFFNSSPHGRVVAFYPSPAGATESLLALETWNDVVNDNPILAEMTPDVEALLVNRVGAARGVPAAVLHRSHRRMLQAGGPDSNDIGTDFPAARRCGARLPAILRRSRKRRALPREMASA